MSGTLTTYHFLARADRRCAAQILSRSRRGFVEEILRWIVLDSSKVVRVDGIRCLPFRRTGRWLQDIDVSNAFRRFESTSPKYSRHVSLLFLTSSFVVLMRFPPSYHLEYARRLLGDNLSDQLNLPRGTWRDRFGVEFDIIASKLLVEFGRVYRKGWDLERQQLFAQVFELLVVWQLGSRRSTFAWREEASQAKALAETEGEDAVSLFPFFSRSR